MWQSSGFMCFNKHRSDRPQSQSHKVKKFPQCKRRRAARETSLYWIKEEDFLKDDSYTYQTRRHQEEHGNFGGPARQHPFHGRVTGINQVSKSCLTAGVYWCIWECRWRGRTLDGQRFLCTLTTNALRLRRLMCKTQEKLWKASVSSLSTVTGWCSYLWLIVTDCLHGCDSLSTAPRTRNIEFQTGNLRRKTSTL